eukprot:CAMPEP_0117649480 /NCGR_PEP_ID=MMETSP0804-20121206/995_1 /TAXON_ID=1074897 /ORGANISM="Tetraselmis astigmatica, Strain CCMP880" /LENGTH=387 /DNA_ID=CAMNT_0005455221 /DNA_START=81 /DNA_END=1244 /DNA_ORIENTATION=-
MAHRFAVLALVLTTAEAGAILTATARHAPRPQSTLPSTCGYPSIMATGHWMWKPSGELERVVSHWTGEDLSQLGSKEQLQLWWRHPNCTNEETNWPEILLKTQHHKRLLFLGDSTMSYLHKAFVRNSHLRCRAPHRIQEDRCSLAQYLAVVAPHRFPHGERQFGEGPFKIGMDFPGCTDCIATAQKCRSRLEAEYVPMEHARDKTVSSADFQTTQDVLLQHHLKKFPADVVVVNAGLHAMAMCSFAGFEEAFPGRQQAKQCWEKRTSQYTEDVRLLLERLQAAAGTVLWLSINAINDGLQDKSRISFSNDLSVQQFNAAMEEITRELSIPVLDVYRMSSLPFAMHELHSDPVHLHNRGDLYYRELAALVAQAIIEIQGTNHTAAADR